ncbi:MAG: hypothetical protein FJW56_03680 [Actinobacteria bacterium]|nr:hypothetical protein [Actinomycetota bacterium]
MKKEIIREKIFAKHYDGLRISIPVSDLPKNILPTDSIDIQKVEGNYTENNSWDDHTILLVYRDREETDDEFAKRKLEVDALKEQSRKQRYEQYLKLKEEFKSNS